MLNTRYMKFLFKLIRVLSIFVSVIICIVLGAYLADIAALGKEDYARGIEGDTFDYEGFWEYSLTYEETVQRLAADIPTYKGRSDEEFWEKYMRLKEFCDRNDVYLKGWVNKPKRGAVYLPWQEPRRHYVVSFLRPYDKGPHVDPWFREEFCAFCRFIPFDPRNYFGCFTQEAWMRYSGFTAWNVIPIKLLFMVGQRAALQQYPVAIHYPMILLIVLVVVVLSCAIFFFCCRRASAFVLYRLAVLSSSIILLMSFFFVFLLHWQQFFYLEFFKRTYSKIIPYKFEVLNEYTRYPETFHSYMVTTPFGPFGFDHLSGYFVFLTCLTSFFAICSAYDLHPRFDHYRFYSLIFAIQFFMIMTFCSVELLHFYIFFEASMIPMFLIIGYWGSGTRATFAAYTFFFYTMLGSIFLLFSIICLNFWTYLHAPTGFRGSLLWGGINRYGREDGYPYPTFRMPIFGDIGNGYLDFVQMCSSMPLTVQLLLFTFMFLAFAVKVPIMPFHRWLPEAHVEAPTAGSVLLAGVLLKLGGYGLIRISALFPLAVASLKPFILVLAFMSILYSSIVIFYQHDFKKIVAYASIGHMNYVVLGLFSGNYYGLVGSIYVMISHAFTSVALFMAIGFLYYKYGTRNIFRYGDLATNMPIFTFFFFLGCLANFSFPGSGGFIGEFLVFLGLVNLNWFLTVSVAITAVLSVLYTIWFFNRLCLRRFNINNLAGNSIFIFDSGDLSPREIWLIILIVVGAYIIGLFPNYIISHLDGFCTFFIWQYVMLSGLVV